MMIVPLFRHFSSVDAQYRLTLELNVAAVLMTATAGAAGFVLALMLGQ